MSDLEEQLKWFDENLGSPSCNDSHRGSPAFPASSGGSAHYPHASGSQQRHHLSAVHAHAPQQQPSYAALNNRHASSDHLAAAIMRQRPPTYPQAQARPTGPHYPPPQGPIMRRPQTPSYPDKPSYVKSRDPDGTERYYLKTATSLVEVDPVERGLTHAPQYRSSPPGPPIYQSDPLSSASLRSAAHLNASRARQSSSQGFPRASQNLYQDDEDMFDQMDADMDWDAIPAQPVASPQRFPRPFGLRQQPAPAPNQQLIALQRALQAERQRANMAESMLSRVHGTPHRQPSDPNLHADSSADMMTSSPTAGYQNGLNQQRQFLTNTADTSFEFDPQYRRQARGPQPGGNAAAGPSQQRVAAPTADNQNKGGLASQWGLPSNNSLLTLKRSAYVPPIITSHNIPIVPKSAIPDIFSSIFPFQTFNQVQSACVPIILKTDENMVVTAPTGAGKTVLFELAMIRLWQCEKEGQIVYIAPTKSLCSERFRDWSSKFSNLRQKCVELTGDTQEGALKDAKTARVIITTPEKWDAVTRNLRGGIPWYDGVKVFCIDEVHLLAEERGATLEVIVSRMKAVNPDIRFVAVSATVPNIEDVAVWLGPGKIAPNRPTSKDAEGNVLPPMARVMKFGDEFRPVPLQKHVHAYPCGTKGDQQFDGSLNYKLLELIEKYASRKPVLVFCNTRKGCVTAARQLMKDYQAHCNRRSGVPPWPVPTKPKEQKFQDSSLADLAASGIGVHHAGMDYRDRRLTEALYLQGNHLHVICTTSTLAVGINLPARMVIIKGTKIWDASQGKAIDYTDLDILQMMGRAGRPQFDSCGVAVIMCKQDEKMKYENMVKSQTILESCLHKTLVEHINSEIATSTIKTLEDAYCWLRGSFLYVRIRANPEHYRAVVPNIFEMDDEDAENPEDFACVPTPKPLNPEKRLEEMVADALKQLVEEGLAEENDGEIESTDYGDMLCQYSIRFSTFLSLKNMEAGATSQQLLAEMCKAVEFKDLKFRAGEKGEYIEWNKREELQWPIRKVSESCDKVNILIQLQLGGVSPWELKISGCNPGGECLQIMQHIKRIVACVVDLATHKKDAAMSKAALELSRCVKAHCWENSYAVLSQFENVGPKYARALAECGIKSIEDLRKASPSTVDEACKKKLGIAVVGAARQMPDFEITAKILKETVRVDGIGATCQFTISLKNVRSVKVTTKNGARKLTASILLMTSDNQWVDYKRSKVLTIQSENDGNGLIIKKTVILTKPSQKIECYVCCDEIAGLTAKAVLVPETPAVHYPIPDFEEDEESATKTSIHDASDFDEDGEAIVKTRALKQAPSKTKKADTAEDSETKRLPNGSYKCRHTCQGACRHTCCVEGLARKPKEVVRKTTTTLKQKTNYISDEGSDSERPTSKAKRSYAPKRIQRRSAQEIVNSMLGSDKLTSTSVKFDRLPRSPHSDNKTVTEPSWLKTISDAADSDTLPDLTAVVVKPKKSVEAKRTRDFSPENDQEEAPPKKSKAISAEPEQAVISKSLKKAPSTKPLSFSTNPPEILSPRRPNSRIMASPDSPPPSSNVEVTEAQKAKSPIKRPLFRSPSAELKDVAIDRKTQDSSATEESDVDELQQDTKDWMEENVEIID